MPVWKYLVFALVSSISAANATLAARLTTSEVQAVAQLRAQAESNDGIQKQEFVIPGTLTRDILVVAIEEEIRDKIIRLAASGNVTKESIIRERLMKESGDLSGLKPILEELTFDLPIDPIQQEILGFITTINIDGTCGDISVSAIGLDYKSGTDTLTYMVDVEDIGIICDFDVVWDTGVLDVDDELTITVEIESTDVVLSTTLLGGPPTSSTIDGCQIALNIESISSKGGFSSNILNELEEDVMEIVEAEMDTISDLICEQVTTFTSTIDELLFSLSEAIEPYLIPVGIIDPLRLEKSLVVFQELVSFREGDFATILTVILKNLKGVFGADQVNTLIELNLLDENGVYVLDLEPIDQSGGSDRDKDKNKDDKNKDKDDKAEKDNDDVPLENNVGTASTETCSLGLRRQLREVERRLVAAVHEQVVGDFQRRRLEEEAPPLFTLNDFILNRVEVIGLNTFTNFELPRVIGEYTLQSKLSVEDLQFRLTGTVDAIAGNAPLREVVQATIDVGKLDVTASYLVGLSKAVVDTFSLGTFLNGDSVVPCIQSSLVAVGVSELDVMVDSIVSPIVQGFLSPGVDELVNTALEGVFVTYQDLFLQAVPNIFQKNVTVAANDFFECYVRTDGANGFCPPTTAQ